MEVITSKVMHVYHCMFQRKERMTSAITFWSVKMVWFTKVEDGALLGSTLLVRTTSQLVCGLVLVLRRNLHPLYRVSLWLKHTSLSAIYITGIGLIGDFTNSVPSQAAQTALKNLISCGEAAGELSRGSDLTTGRVMSGKAFYDMIQRCHGLCSDW